MRRLTGWGRRSERGASVVLVALLFVALLGFTAIAIDVAAIWWDRKQAQNGADAAALAIAQSCAAGVCDSTTTAAMAQDYASKNKAEPSQAFTGTAVVDAGAGFVTATVTTTRQNWFAPFLGADSTQVTAAARAQWGWLSGGNVVPIALSNCEFYTQTGGWDDQGQPFTTTELIIDLKTRDTCSWPAHSEVPGGFGWLLGPNCSAKVYAGSWVYQDPGNDGSNSCKDEDWTTIQNVTLQVPIFDAWDDHAKSYHVAGIAGFKVTGYCFPSGSWNYAKCNTGAGQGIKGYFVRYRGLDGDLSTDPAFTHFGDAVIRLVG